MKKKVPYLHLKASPQIFRNAKELRKNMTPAEERMWEVLRARRFDNHKFRRQHPIERYILDFYCHALKLGIEIDGAYHQDKVQAFYDEDRTQNLEDLGDIKVIRFTNEEVLKNLDQVLSAIRTVIKHLSN